MRRTTWLRRRGEKLDKGNPGQEFRVERVSSAAKRSEANVCSKPAGWGPLGAVPRVWVQMLESSAEEAQ